MSDQWNATLYDQNHGFVTNYGQSLLEFLNPKAGEQILDIGCGTGDLANQIAQSGAQVYGIDASLNMIVQAKAKYPALQFSNEDATQLTFSNTFDAVFSNATLHWIKEPQKVLACLYNALKPNGRFVVEFGGKGNVKTITDEILRQFQNLDKPLTVDQFPWYFPSIAEYTTLLEQVGFDVLLAQHYDRPTPLIGHDGLKNWIEMFGGLFFEQLTELEKQHLIQQVEQNLRSKLLMDGEWIADYKRLRIVAVKRSK
jgi:trans-aconitate methyltransferase